jgi:hypothetical protein
MDSQQDGLINTGMTVIANSISETGGNHISFCFGRMNPPHYGHEGVINTVSATAKGGSWAIFVSKSHDSNKNPLPYTEKVQWIYALYPQVRGHLVEDPAIKTVLQAAAHLFHKGFTSATFVAGEDDMEQMSRLLKDYNGVEGKGHGYYKFEPLTFAVSARLTSATSARQAAKDNDPDAFERATRVPTNITVHGKTLFQAVRSGMNLGESMNLKPWLNLLTLPCDEPIRDAETRKLREHFRRPRMSRLLAYASKLDQALITEDATARKITNSMRRMHLNDVPELLSYITDKYATQHLDIPTTSTIAEEGVKLPGIGPVGSALDAYDAYNKAQQGDYTGAAISGISGIAGMIPHPAAQGLHLGLDAISAIRDLNKGSNVPYTAGLLTGTTGFVKKPATGISIPDVPPSKADTTTAMSTTPAGNDSPTLSSNRPAPKAKAPPKQTVTADITGAAVVPDRSVAVLPWDRWIK